MYDFGIEEKEFQLMLDVANEKLELNENRFRIISNTMHRIRDSGKLSEYDKTQVSLLCNKFSIAIENLNGKTEYEVAMEEMSGGMMALIAAAIAAVIAMLAKMFGFFGTTTDGTAPTKANLEALKTTSNNTSILIKDMGIKFVELNNKILNINTTGITLSQKVSSNISLIKEHKNLLCVCDNIEYGEWGYPKFTIIKKSDTDSELIAHRENVKEIFNKVFANIIGPSEKIFTSALNFLDNNAGDKITELVKTIPTSDINDEEFDGAVNKFKELIRKRKDEKVTVNEKDIWDSISIHTPETNSENYTTFINFIRFLDETKLRADKLRLLNEKIADKDSLQLSGIDELKKYISRYGKYSSSYAIVSDDGVDETIYSIENLKSYVDIVAKIIEVVQEIKSELLKNNITEARNIDTIIASITLMFNNIIDNFIEVTKTVPKFEVTKTSRAFKVCEEIAGKKKFKLTQ